MNLALRLNGAVLDELYQTPTDVTYWCVEQKRWAKRNPALLKANRFASPRCSTTECYNKYAAWCWNLARSWCKDHQEYISEPYVYSDSITFPSRIITKGQQNKAIYNDMRTHLADVRKLLEVGAEFCVI